MTNAVFKILNFKQTSIALYLSLALLSNCAQDAGLEGLEGSLKKRQGKFQADQAEDPFDFSKECGLSQEKLDNKDAVLVDGSFTSFPIISQGTSMGTAFQVATQAKLQVSATAKQTTQNLQVNFLDSVAQASGIAALIAPAIVKSKAKAAAAKATGTTITKAMPKGEWLKLTNGTIPEFKDLLCATNGIRTVEIAKGGGQTTVTYTPALISSVNPLAPPERMRTEFGQGRQFNVTANVSANAGHIVAGSYTGVITVQEAIPSFTNEGQTLNADIAYRFENDFPGGAYKLGLPRVQTIFIDAQRKVIKAIINEDDRIDETTGQQPAVVLIRDN